ncbi:MAG: glycosyltransferase family A protein [Bacteroidota bacterium]
MLSILIPIYNFDVTDLVEALHQQCLDCEIPFEIIAYDDQSEVPFRKANQAIDRLERVVYVELKENMGRSRIRNAMAKAAQYAYLLFMDGDSGVVKSDYIKTYLAHLNPRGVLYGGRVYQVQPPQEQAYLLHWTYGRQREESKAVERSEAPYHAFMSNNFLMPSQLFLDIQFDEALLQYGHEDTVFGLELKKRDIPIHHLDNPLLHLGLEPTERFLSKTQKAIWNLYQLYQQDKPIDTRLLASYRRLKTWGLSLVFSGLFAVNKGWIMRNLRSTHPRMLYFDLYKLAQLLKVSRAQASEFSQKK